MSEAAPAAAAFAVAWARPAVAAARWWKDIAGLCDQHFAEQLRTVEPGNLPASRVTGKPKATYPPRDGGGQYTVATDGGTLIVNLADIGGTWLVVSNDFKRAPR